ncbi:MAG: hypothetical protein RLZZ387_5022 [Chloroflexota bacterium]|jgi:hypothetical protein
MASTPLPPAVEALAQTPHLRSQAGRSLALQAGRIAERAASFIPRPELLGALDSCLGAGGLIAVEGPRGSGATALLCHLAAARPYVFWLPEEDAGGGLMALCAQVAALEQLPLALVPPAAGQDITALERLLAEAGAARRPGDPLVLLVGRPADTDVRARPDLFPTAVPAGVAIVLAHEYGTPQIADLTPTARLTLPSSGHASAGQLAGYAAALGAPAQLAAALAARARGSFLYVRLAVGLLAAGVLRRRALPVGLQALHQEWWDALDPADHRLLTALVAAAEPVDLALAATVAGLSPEDARARAARWHALLEQDGRRARVYHPATAGFIAAQDAPALERAHGAFAAVALAYGAVPGRAEESGRGPAHRGYFSRQLARHIALSGRATRGDLATEVAQRPWVLAQQRATGDHHTAAADMAWELRAAASDGSPLRLVRSAAVAGTLSLLSRSLPLDAPAEALGEALKRDQAREPTLRRVRAMVDQLPDGRDKAQILRRLGEVCFALRMRASAMRMLSEALDLETPGLPRAWRDEREEALVALARAAITTGAPDIALGITTRIVHPERRGMIETEVVRWLLARDHRTRAEEVAYAIGHAGNHEWAMAEVAVGHARAGDYERAGVVLSTLRTETAVAWVSTEIACDAARRSNPRAVDRVAMLPGRSLRDRALTQVALAMVDGGMADQALDVARMVLDDEVRARGLVELALAHPPLAPEALDEASQAVAGISGEEQAPVVAALAAAQAAIGRPEDALRTAGVLPEGEGRDRAQSRIAVALARAADFVAAGAVAGGIQDDDERDWALDELARLVGAAGDWRAGFELAGGITAEEQRARTEADLAIGWARAGEPAVAQARARRIPHTAERLRAETAIAAPLAAAGARVAAFEAIAALHEPGARSRYQAAAVQALASNGALDDALAIAGRIARPVERARALVTATRASALAGDYGLAHATLSEALREVAAIGRRETFLCLGWAADALAELGGGELLLAAAGALDEVDSWWA